jgi:hypothetical protein
MSFNCNIIHQWFSEMRKFTFPFEKKDIPGNGVYVLFEKDEFAHNTNRIVRVGSHTGQNQLHSRLEQHFIKENKDRSIFRKNIGRAILNKNNDPFLMEWDIDLTTRKAKERYLNAINLSKQKAMEKMVTEYIQNNICFSVIPIDEKEQRLKIESRIISTVSLCDNCTPSDKWLGNFSPKEKIRRSGLWLVNELWKQPLSENDMSNLKYILKGTHKT